MKGDKHMQKKWKHKPVAASWTVPGSLAASSSPLWSLPATPPRDLQRAHQGQHGWQHRFCRGVSENHCGSPQGPLPKPWQRPSYTAEKRLLWSCCRLMRWTSTFSDCTGGLLHSFCNYKDYKAHDREVDVNEFIPRSGSAKSDEFLLVTWHRVKLLPATYCTVLYVSPCVLVPGDGVRVAPRWLWECHGPWPKPWEIWRVPSRFFPTRPHFLHSVSPPSEIGDLLTCGRSGFCSNKCGHRTS